MSQNKTLSMKRIFTLLAIASVFALASCGDSSKSIEQGEIDADEAFESTIDSVDADESGDDQSGDKAAATTTDSTATDSTTTDSAAVDTATMN